MSFSRWILVVAVAFLPFAATAQQAGRTQQPNPADANAAVMETSYVSTFKSYINIPEEATTPDQVWRTANEEVARGDPHAGHGGHGSMSGMTTPASAQQPDSSGADTHAAHRGHGGMPGMKAEPAAQKPASTQSDRHAGHGGHNMQGK